MSGRVCNGSTPGVETGFAEVDARFAEARMESEARFNQVHLRLAELRAQLDTRFAELRAELDTRFAQIDTRFVEMRTDMAGIETRITRWFIGILLAQFATVIAMLIRQGVF